MNKTNEILTEMRSLHEMRIISALPGFNVVIRVEHRDELEGDEGVVLFERCPLIAWQIHFLQGRVENIGEDIDWPTFTHAKPIWFHRGYGNVEQAVSADGNLNNVSAVYVEAPGEEPMTDEELMTMWDQQVRYQ